MQSILAVAIALCLVAPHAVAQMAQTTAHKPAAVTTAEVAIEFDKTFAVGKAKLGTLFADSEAALSKAGRGANPTDIIGAHNHVLRLVQVFSGMCKLAPDAARKASCAGLLATAEATKHNMKVLCGLRGITCTD
jgi:hypothetical protein